MRIPWILAKILSISPRIPPLGWWICVHSVWRNLAFRGTQINKRKSRLRLRHKARFSFFLSSKSFKLWIHVAHELALFYSIVTRFLLSSFIDLAYTFSIYSPLLTFPISTLINFNLRSYCYHLARERPSEMGPAAQQWNEIFIHRRAVNLSFKGL